MPDQEHKHAGVFITLPTIYAKLTEVENSVREIKNISVNVTSLQEHINDLETRTNRVEKLLAGHAVIITLVTGGVAAIIANYFT